MGQRRLLGALCHAAGEPDAHLTAGCGASAAPGRVYRFGGMPWLRCKQAGME
jgi:hypothetical protein